MSNILNGPEVYSFRDRRGGGEPAHKVTQLNAFGLADPVGLAYVNGKAMLLFR